MKKDFTCRTCTRWLLENSTRMRDLRPVLATKRAVATADEIASTLELWMALEWVKVAARKRITPSSSSFSAWAHACEGAGSQDANSTFLASILASVLLVFAEAFCNLPGSRKQVIKCNQSCRQANAEKAKTDMSHQLQVDDSWHCQSCSGFARIESQRPSFENRYWLINGSTVLANPFVGCWTALQPNFGLRHFFVLIVFYRQLTLSEISPQESVSQLQELAVQLCNTDLQTGVAEMCAVCRSDMQHNYHNDKPRLRTTPLMILTPQSSA